MALRTLTILVAAAGCACAAPVDAVESDKSVLEPNGIGQQKDLNAAASSSYGRSYSDWGGYPSASSSGYSVTGYGSLDNKYNNYNSYYGGYGGNSGYSGYAGSPGYGGYAGSPGYSGYAGGSGYSGYAGSPGYSGYAGSPGYSGYSGSPGYGSYDYNGYSRYGGGYGLSSAAGNGGYGGYGGNGGLLSYYGYNSPYNQGGNHLGFGYYKRTGNIYNSGVTPSLVTGYRGYSRR